MPVFLSFISPHCCLRLQVAFPYLYNNRPRKVRLSVYHYPMVMYIKAEDPDLPAFYYDPLIHPIAFYKTEGAGGAWGVLEDEEEDAFVLPEGVEPFLAEQPVYTDSTSAGVALLWAPKPFNARSGRTRRACDVPLVNNWFMEHCPGGYPGDYPAILIPWAADDPSSLFWKSVQFQHIILPSRIFLSLVTLIATSPTSLAMSLLPCSQSACELPETAEELRAEPAAPSAAEEHEEAQPVQELGSHQILPADRARLGGGWTAGIYLASPNAFLCVGSKVQLLPA